MEVHRRTSSSVLGKLKPMHGYRALVPLLALAVLAGCKNEPLPPTLVVFTSDRDGSLQVYTMQANGASPTRITDLANANWDASLSGAGTKMVYTSTRGGNTDIYINNILGNNEQRRTSQAAAQYQAQLNLPGDKIAYVDEKDGNPEIYIMTSGGMNPVRLTTTANTVADTMPCFSPGGGRIAFVSNRDGNNEIYVMDTSGGSLIRITTDGADDITPVFTSGGDNIVFASNRGGTYQLYSRKSDGTGPTTQLTVSAGNKKNPSFSIDGQKMFFTNDALGNERIFMADANGANETDLSQGASNDTKTATWIAP
jgi:Tol biopolymer transport system component